MDAETFQKLTAEIQAVVSAVEEITGLTSRWNGGVTMADATSALLSAPPFTAKKEWDCRITVMEVTASRDSRWRSFIHEALHSVSVGLRPQDYAALEGWEEDVVETLQRHYRSEILYRLGVYVPDTIFTEVELIWPFEPYIEALKRLSQELMNVTEREFFETLLKTPLKNRPSVVFGWGKIQAKDSVQFVRTFAECSGKLR